MHPEGIRLSEINQRKTNTISSHLYVESGGKKEKELIGTENRLVVARERQVSGKIGVEDVKKYKLTVVSHGNIVYGTVITATNIYLKIAKSKSWRF